MRPTIGLMKLPTAPSRSCTPGMSAAATIATAPSTTVALVADDARADPVVPRDSASSSVVRASESASPAAATTMSASGANAPRSTWSAGSGRRTASAMTKPANGAALRASVHRVAPRAMERMRHRYASPRMPNSTARESSAKPSASRVGRMKPHPTAPASATTSTNVLVRSLLISRMIETRSSATPKSASTVASTGTAPRPAAIACTSVASAAKATASTKHRDATRRTPNALARTPELRGMQDVQHDAPRNKVRRHLLRHRRDAEREHTVSRASQREQRASEAGRDLRRHHDERGAPRDAAALRKEHRLRRVHRIGAETREDFEAALQRPWTAGERGPRTFMCEVVDAVRDESHLTARVGGVPHEVRCRGDDELDGFRIGLDPVLVI